MRLEEAYDRFAPQLYRHALALTRNAADAEDSVQNVFLKLEKRLRQPEPPEDLESYLHVAVRREALRVLEKRRRPAPAADLVQARNGLPPEEVGRVNRALLDLPAEQREVVVLHVFQKMSFRRIGELLSIPLDTAASRYRYAREKLKEALGGD